MIPLLAFHPNKDKTCQKTGNKRNSKINKHALSNLSNGDFGYCIACRNAKPRRSNSNKKPGIHRKEQHLKNTVESHQTGCILCIAFCKVIPHNYHSNTTSQTNHYYSIYIRQVDIVLAGKEFEHQNGKCKHQYRSHNPILNQ